MNSRAIEYSAWVARIVASGERLTSYVCPGCDMTLLTLVPPEGDEHDTMVRCAYCNHIHYKIVDDEGRVEVLQQ